MVKEFDTTVVVSGSNSSTRMIHVGCVHVSFVSIAWLNTSHTVSKNTEGEKKQLLPHSLSSVKLTHKDSGLSYSIKPYQTWHASPWYLNNHCSSHVCCCGKF